jgi:putative ABC transport system permease protein
VIRAFRANARDHRASILVAALSSAFGVSLLACTNVLGAYIATTDVGAHGSAQFALALVAGVFFVIAVFVGAIVTTNTFATVIAGRTRTIALMRLLGATARAQRRSVAGEGFTVGVIGAASGGVVAVVSAFVAVRVFVWAGVLPDTVYPVLTLSLLAPPIVVVLTTWSASWIGSRRVLGVAPVEALGAAEERPSSGLRSRGRTTAALLLIVPGAALLGFGLALGLGLFERADAALAEFGRYGVLVAMLGGLLSFTGVIVAAPLFLPAVLRGIGLLLGRGAATRLAAANALRSPERSSRTTIGLVIGVTLITMFVVATQTWVDIIRAAAAKEPGLYQGTEGVLTVTMLVFSALVGFSAVIAAVGVVNSLSLAVLQRRRELGLLRALGLSAAQVRRMILAESAQLVVAAVLCGLVLGTLYGWLGAQSLLGQLPGAAFIAPAVPWPFIGAIVVAAAVLAVGASVAPTRRATRVSPVEALAVD